MDGRTACLAAGWLERALWLTLACVAVLRWEAIKNDPRWRDLGAAIAASAERIACPPLLEAGSADFIKL